MIQLKFNEKEEISDKFIKSLFIARIPGYSCFINLIKLNLGYNFCYFVLELLNMSIFLFEKY